ncbi:sodium:solute symporter family transporter [Aeoliella sp.]|uniref:sodium:solute symporter family transporter n=1 Tax=Aeoliella sp. TaxID=2795800 RepID=UPI003CCBFFED
MHRLIATYASLLACITMLACTSSVAHADASHDWLEWRELPDLPDPLGVAGPIVGLSNDCLIVAGGANFPKPVWDNEKQWHDDAYVLTRSGEQYTWKHAGKLPAPVGYSAVTTLPDGVLALGGNDAKQVFDKAMLLKYVAGESKLQVVDFPALPAPNVFGQAAVIGNVVYLSCGQSGQDLATATDKLWSLNLELEADEREWKELPPCPGGARALHMMVAQHNGYDQCLYVIGGRRIEDGKAKFLSDNWEYNPRTNSWRERNSAPQAIAAGTAVPSGQSHILVLSGDDGSLFDQADALGDDHPGFTKTSFAYHTITNAWEEIGETPQNQVTTPAVKWGGEFIVASGEVRPRVRTPAVWAVSPKHNSANFGTLNYLVLISYLLAMVGVGLYCNRNNKDTDDYFRGGKQLPWWAAGCSIFATMLSSLTFTGIPSKAFAQDWVYAVGNFMIPVVAILAVFLALPFYRMLDVTSAYEYLELRFNRKVRKFGSLSFTLFHLFRMAVVMSLTGLALAVATPLTPTQCVLLMGVLSIAYCTIGGIEAVIWTDTIQTFVLFGGALLALALLIGDTGFSTFASSAAADGKLHMANLGWDATSTQLVLWVVILGGIGQNVSSYTADQAVVQRYLTTPTEKLAARSIWTNAVLTIPATLLFFGIGTALYVFYKTHPERLSPTISTDQVFPYFIASEMPIGISGLVVAGIFAAAQSTVSTSMNSIATTIVTDFLQSDRKEDEGRSYLGIARWITFSTGVLGTLVGLLFVDPQIKSLFDAFLIVIGLFMGVLGGLFALGFVSKRANAFGAMCGALVGAGTMAAIWLFTPISGYIYTTIGILTCLIVGWVTSQLAPAPDPSTERLTLYALSGMKKSQRNADFQPAATTSTSLP